MAPPQPAAAGAPTHLQAGPRRKALGQWFTPPALVAHVVGCAIAGTRGPIRRVLDPACGDGRFLAAVRDEVGGPIELVGTDIDDEAVAAARRNVPEATIERADALQRDWGTAQFDLVIGNPPFLNQLATATTRGGRSRFGGGPYADAAAEFLALATRLARPDGGRVALVLPQSVLTARDAAAIRADVSARGTIVHAWWTDDTVFDARVHVCVLVVELGAPCPERAVTRTHGLPASERGAVVPGDAWGRLLLEAPAPWSGDRGEPRLGDVASFAVDFRDQYYGLIGAVGDDVDGPPLVTSGLIDVGVCRWGERPARFAKQRFAAPRVALDRVSPKLQAWAGSRLVPKILIANQTAVIESVIDRDGAWLPSVPVISCTADDLDAACDVLSSPGATAWVRERAAGSGLSPRAVRLTPALLASIPLTAVQRPPTRSPSRSR